MSTYLDISFAKQLSYRLDRFKIKSEKPFKANCRCPLCGDSQKKISKARFWFIESESGDGLLCHCFNCGASLSFSKFLKIFDINLFDRYRLEKFRGAANSLELIKKEETEEIVPEVPNVLLGLDTIDDLPKHHKARLYIENRQIHEQFWSKLYYAPKFCEWARGHEPELFKFSRRDHPRIVIPWFNVSGKCFAYSARSLNGEEPKYYKIKLNKKDNSFFGMERLKFHKQIYVCEGPIDSLIIDNCIAVGNANIGVYDNPDAIYIPDKDVRNIEVINMIGNLIDSGKKVFLAPHELNGKDLNEYIESGVSVKDLMSIIAENTFSGLAAKLRFISWRKVVNDEKRYIRRG